MSDICTYAAIRRYGNENLLRERRAPSRTTHSDDPRAASARTAERIVLYLLTPCFDIPVQPVRRLWVRFQQHVL